MAIKVTAFDIEKYASITIHDSEWEDSKYIWNAKKGHWDYKANDGDGWYAMGTETTLDLVTIVNAAIKENAEIKYGKAR